MLHRGNVERYSDIDRISLYREFSLRDTCSAIQYVSFSLASKVSIAMHRILSDIISKEVAVGVPDRRLLRFSLHHANRIAHRINPSIFQRRNPPSRVSWRVYLVSSSKSSTTPVDISKNIPSASGLVYSFCVISDCLIR